MNGLRKILGFLTVIMLVAFAGSALAASGNNKVYNLNVVPTAPLTVGATGAAIVVKFDNVSPDGNSTFKSIKLFAPTGITITAASVGAGYTGTATLKNNGTAVWVDTINLPVKPFGPTFLLNLTVNVGCGVAGNWTTIDPAAPNKGDQVWTGTGFTGQNFGYKEGVVNTTVTGSCFGVTYDGNGSTAGAVPLDSNQYAKDAAVTVLGNTGNLVKTGNYFVGWTLSATPLPTDTVYSAGSIYTMGTSAPTFFAKWSTKALSITNPPTSAVVGTSFTVTVNSDPAGAVVTFDQGGCQATATNIGNVFTITVNKLPVTGTCTMTFNALPDYPPLPLPIQVTGVLSCTEYDSVLGQDNFFFDPDSDTALVGTPTVPNGWGLRRSLKNIEVPTPSACVDVNYTFSLINNVAAFIYDNPLGQKLSVKYVILFNPVNSTNGWTAVRPDVAWVTSAGLPVYVPGLACLHDDQDDPTLGGAAVMPTIPNEFPFDTYPSTSDYFPGKKAKVCIAQVGWTSIAGKIQYWLRVIDQGDAWVKTPS